MKRGNRQRKGSRMCVNTPLSSPRFLSALSSCLNEGNPPAFVTLGSHWRNTGDAVPFEPGLIATAITRHYVQRNDWHLNTVTGSPYPPISLATPSASLCECITKQPTLTPRRTASQHPTHSKQRTTCSHKLDFILETGPVCLSVQGALQTRPRARTPARC